MTDYPGHPDEGIPQHAPPMVKEMPAGTRLVATLLDPGQGHRFERARDLMEYLLELEPGTRFDRLISLTDGDSAMRTVIEQLLSEMAASEAEGFLEVPVCDFYRADARSPEQMPDVVGNYRLLSPLGEGATGVVFRGTSPPPLQREVAVKITRIGISERAASRFAIEIEALSSLNHANIALVYEAGQMPDGRRWLACELIEGEPITKAAQALMLGWRERVDLIRQAAEGVHHAHQRGVIHRDLKPSNLLVTMDESGHPLLKLIDFGIARLIGPRAVQEANTEPGLLVGTLAYMSPEQMTGGEVEARSDVYALGLVLDDVLGGRSPRRDKPSGLHGLVKASQQQLVVRLHNCDGRERDLEAVISKATEPTLGDRYASAQHIADDLARILKGLPISARRASVAYVLRRFAGRHPWLTTLSAVASIGLIGLTTLLAYSRAELSNDVHVQRQLVASLVTNSLHQLSNISGTAESRRAMVESLLDHTDRLLVRQPKDQDLLRAKARLLRERGDIQALIGKTEESYETLKESLSLYASLIEASAHSIYLGRAHAEGIIRVGDSHRALGRPVEALVHYSMAKALLQSLLSKHPGHIGLLDDLCWSYDRMVELSNPDDHDNMLHILTTRLELSQHLLSLDPDRSLSQYNHAVAFQRLGRYYLVQHPQRSLSYMFEALPITQNLLHREPDREAFATSHIWQLQSIGMIYRETGNDMSQARSYYQLAVEAAELHAKAAPTSIRAQQQLGSTLVTLSQALSSEGYEDQALETSQRAIMILTRVIDITQPHQNDSVYGLLQSAKSIPDQAADLDPE